MSFKFRFDSILQLRRRERDEVGASVGKVNEAIARVDEQIQQVEKEREELNQGTAQRLLGSVSVDGLLASGRYDFQLQVDLQSLFDTRKQLVEEQDRRMQALVVAEGEVKRFERMLENEREAHYAEQLRREQLEADDATSRRYTMTRQRHF